MVAAAVFLAIFSAGLCLLFAADHNFAVEHRCLLCGASALDEWGTCRNCGATNQKGRAA